MNLKKKSNITKDERYKKREKFLINTLAVLLIAAGIGFLAYTPLRTAYSAYMQKQFLKEIKEAMNDSKESGNNERSSLENTDNGTEQQSIENKTEQPREIDEFSENRDPVSNSFDEEFTDLELTENEQSEEESPEKTRERLKNQKVIGIIEIEKIDLIYAIVEGTSDENLGVAIGHMSETAAIGQTGNCALAGHRGGTSGPYFKHVDELVNGDLIKLTDIQGTEYEYKVTETFIVEPTEVWVAQNDTTDKILTLITCTDSGSKRFIVRATAV